MSASALEAALREASIPCTVEAQERLAIITGNPALFARADARRRALALAEAHGFTHLALEMAADIATDAPPAARATLHRA